MSLTLPSNDLERQAHISQFKLPFLNKVRKEGWSAFNQIRPHDLSYYLLTGFHVCEAFHFHLKKLGDEIYFFLGEWFFL